MNIAILGLALLHAALKSVADEKVFEQLTTTPSLNPSVRELTKSVPLPSKHLPVSSLLTILNPSKLTFCPLTASAP